jgi:SAM-dependent methyltransferase
MAYNKEWFNDEDFWEQFAPIMFGDKRWNEVAEVADSITRFAALGLYEGGARKKPPCLLDLCCGFGRISLELARRGFSVTGVDITASYLATARDDAAYENLDVEFIQDDIRHFKRKNAFDTAVNLYNSFGYFENPDDDLLFLKNAYYSLKEGGSLIIDVLGKEIAVRDYVEAEWYESNGFTVLTECMPVDSWAGTWNRWILLKDGERHEKAFVQRLYGASELRTLLKSAGFTTVDLYGNWNETPYDMNAETLIAVARK